MTSSIIFSLQPTQSPIQSPVYPRLMISEEGRVILALGEYEQDTDCLRGILLYCRSGFETLGILESNWLKVCFQPYYGSVTLTA